MKTLEKLAKAADLSKYESSIYLSLQNQGPMHVKNIAKFSAIPRTAVYPPLAGLIAKGLVAETTFGKRKFYSAVPFENLKFALEQKRSMLEEVIEELSASRNISSNGLKLDATLYPSKEGIRSAGLIFLEETKEKTWYSFENLGVVAERVGFEFENFYIDERVKRGIKSKMILSVTEETVVVRKILRDDKKDLRETVLLSPNQYPFKTTVAITKGLILLVNPNENPFALLVRNKDLAETFVNIHKCIWDRYTN